MNEKQRAALDAIGAAQSAIAEAVEELRVSLTPEAPPAPAPEPPPPPPPPVDTTVRRRALNMAHVLLWAPWLESSRYQRYQKLALPSDAVISVAAWKAGRIAYWNAGFELTNGAGGFGFFGLPLPWGKIPELDAYLQAYGHSPDGVN